MLNIDISKELIFLAVTIVCYIAARFVYRRSGLMLLHPVFLSLALLWVFTKISGYTIETYRENTAILKYMLDLSVVTFGYLLYKHFETISKSKKAILIATLAGSITGVLSVILICWLLGADLIMMVTIMPKSITTPLAVVASAEHGGVVSLTVVIVILSGILGAFAGPWFLKLCKIESRLAKGLSMGSAAHAIGTAKSLEMGALEGAAGGVAMTLMGLFTIVVIKLSVYFLRFLL